MSFVLLFACIEYPGGIRGPRGLDPPREAFPVSLQQLIGLETAAEPP